LNQLHVEWEAIGETGSESFLKSDESCFLPSPYDLCHGSVVRPTAAPFCSVILTNCESVSTRIVLPDDIVYRESLPFYGGILADDRGEWQTRNAGLFFKVLRV
jgi:hypothetical protein